MARRRSRKFRFNYKFSVNHILIALIIVMILEIFCYVTNRESYFSAAFKDNAVTNYKIEDIGEYGGKGYVIINNNEPEFKESEITTKTFEEYSELDYLGRCGVAYANISLDTMPTETRESIGMVKPSGWQTVKYDNVDGKYLYNRCHLIGFQLAGENANPKNLITCTRQMNATTMLKYENEVANYVKKTNNHVLYRVTPVYDNDDLVARGVQMEALSVEDKGYGLKFNVFVYNVQDGIEINYKNGTSKLIETQE